MELSLLRVSALRAFRERLQRGSSFRLKDWGKWELRKLGFRVQFFFEGLGFRGLGFRVRGLRLKASVLMMFCVS